MVQRIAEGCPSLLYLNLSCTLVTNITLRELSSLQYLSLAYCYKFTDEGFLYLTTGKGCRRLIHLDLSGCTQVSLNGFRYISTGCPSLTEIVLNDLPTLSDNCIMALVAECRCLSAVSLLDAPNLSDAALRAIAKVAKLRTFSTEGNNQFTDWKALCTSSPDLCTLHATECLRMTDASLRSVGALKNLQYLNISLCIKWIQYLTEGASSAKLRELNISHCSRISDTSVKRITQRCIYYCTHTPIYPASLNLPLSQCSPIVSLDGVWKLCKNMRDLEHVDVSHCVALSDSAIRALSFHCRGLITLRMSGCTKMTDMSVQYLTTGAQYLRELDVSGCVLLTDRTPHYLERICPPLCSVTMTCCSGISKSAALKLQPRVDSWEHNSVHPPYYRMFGCIESSEMSVKTSTDPAMRLI
uniref:F-box and leucine-rich repeat protein 13 n=1 Tax=Sphaeramia orbicularis TaxID=375764 RepID=A0A672ZIT3_9TELE